MVAGSLPSPQRFVLGAATYTLTVLHLTVLHPYWVKCTIKCIQIPESINIVRCTAECPADYTYIAPPVNGCYKVVNRNLEWSIAGLECRSLHKDAHLLIINDAAEQLVVAGMLASTNR